MLQLLLWIVSYGSFLLLLMPTKVSGVISAAVYFVLGLGLMWYKKYHKEAWWKSRQYLLMLFVFFFSARFPLKFWNRWLPSSKIKAIAAVLHIPHEAMLLIGTAILTALSCYFLYTVLQIIQRELTVVNQKNRFAGDLISCLLAAVMTVIMAQNMVDTAVLTMGLLKFSVNVLIVFLAILYLYCLFGRVVPSVYFGAGAFMVISTINAYVFSFRDRMFEPVDIFSFGTAMNVADNYSLFPIPAGVLPAWGLFAVMPLILGRLQNKNRTRVPTKRRLGLLAVCIASSAAVVFYAANLKTYHCRNEGALFSGFILDFAAKFKEISVREPDHYSTELIGELADQYAETGPGSGSESPKQPHIIVIMDEAFADLQVAGEFSTNREVMPFISSLKDDAVRGYALASVYGGNTSNSEYEFLTGHSLAWLSPNVVPYQQYIRSPAYSMVSYLKDTYDYRCVAMHPYLSTGWNRPDAYRYLGFDACYFIEDFPQEKYIRDYVSDQEMFEFLIKTYEEQKEEPLFLFGVTMQNHGAYTYTGDDFNKHIELREQAGVYPEVEQYLSLIHETDKAVEYLITYFQRVDEDVVIVFFGDHQPKMDEAFYEMIAGGAADDLDAQQKRYQVPFFIWTNFDIPEAYIECTSLNYLSSYVYDAAGLALPPYNRFLRELEALIPAINANGFYSRTNGCYLPVEEADGQERRWLEWYEALQYNCTMDQENRNERFFPVLEEG